MAESRFFLSNRLCEEYAKAMRSYKTGRLCGLCGLCGLRDEMTKGTRATPLRSGGTAIRSVRFPCTQGSVALPMEFQLGLCIVIAFHNEFTFLKFPAELSPKLKADSFVSTGGILYKHV